MTIAAHDWLKLSQLLDAALTLPVEARAAWVETLGDEHASLVPVLRNLLARSDLVETSGFLATIPKLGDERAPIKADAAAGEIVGPYELDRALGVGGMGSVWLAKRIDGLLNRHVALKLPHFSGTIGELAGRMARERNILATLEHPNIARLYEAGLAADGRPFLALEYVEGEAIDAYCRARACDVRTRVELVLQVARAVAYAHAHLVVHRDLKPSNILVDAQGRVRLLDFGIAKLLDPSLTTTGPATQFVGAALTPGYASPEQLCGEPVSTASDVYSLGVVLYELLCGALPHLPRKDGDALSFAQAMLASEPRRPSDVATDRATRRPLRGDLDTIALKALKKLPAERYATVGAMADDLQSHLRGEPVRARPDSFWYRTRKLIGRNKLAASAMLAVVMTLAIGLALSLWQARMLRTEERTSRAVQQFLEDIFRTNSNEQPDPAKARQTTVTQLLQIGARKVDASLKDAPESRLRVLRTLAQMHDDVELYDEAVELNRKRLTLARSLYGRNDPRVADTLIDLSHAMQETQANAERGGVLAEALSILDRNGETGSLRRGRLLGELSSVYQELNLPKALGYASQAVDVLRAYPHSGALPGSLTMQGYLLAALHRYPQAEQVLMEAVTVSRANQGPLNADLPRLYATTADVQYLRQEFAAAEKSYRDAAQVARARGSVIEADLAQVRLGQFLVRTARAREGLDDIAQASKSIVNSVGEGDSFYVPTVEIYYGRALLDAGRAWAAMAHLERALASLRQYRPGSAGVVIALEKLALASVYIGNLAAVQPLLDEAQQIRQRTGNRETNLNGDVKAEVALLLARGRADDAARALERLYVPPGDGGAGSLTSLKSALLRAEVELAQQHAARARDLATQVYRRVAADVQRTYLKNFEARATLIAGKATTRAGDPAHAEALLRSAVNLSSQIFDATSNPVVSDAEIALALCLLDLGRSDEARALAARARAVQAANERLGPRYRQPMADLQARLQASRGQ